MSAPAPEAETEYSRGGARPRSRSGRRTPRPSRASLGRDGRRPARRRAADRRRVHGPATCCMSRPMARSRLRSRPARTTPTRSIPIALLAAALALAGASARATRPRCWALGALGIVALLIALLGDLPDAQAPRRNHPRAWPSPARRREPGFYLETLGAVLLVAAGGAGLLSRLSDARAPGGRAGVSLRRGRAARACRDERPASRHPDKASVNGSKPESAATFDAARAVPPQPPVPCSGQSSRFLSLLTIAGSECDERRPRARGERPRRRAASRQPRRWPPDGYQR